MLNGKGYLHKELQCTRNDNYVDKCKIVFLIIQLLRRKMQCLINT
jgi:hypothetical protein